MALPLNNMGYIDGVLVYATGNEIYCASCDFVQPTFRVKNDYGITTALSVQKTDWNHAVDCSQRHIIEENEAKRRMASNIERGIME